MRDCVVFYVLSVNFYQFAIFDGVWYQGVIVGNDYEFAASGEDVYKRQKVVWATGHGDNPRIRSCSLVAGCAKSSFAIFLSSIGA